MSKDKRSRGWCFTVNNYTDADLERLGLLENDVEYLIFGKEVGKKFKTPHLQGFLYCDNKKSFEQIKAILPDGTHIEKQKGTLAQAIEYCMKDEDFIEIGERPRQGKRTDLDIIKHDLKKNVNEKQIANKYFSQWCQYRRAFREYKELIKVKQYDTTLIIYDPTVRTSCKNAAYYIGQEDSKSYVSQIYTPDQVWIDYYSKNYQYIVIPYTQWIVDDIEGPDSEEICFQYI